jgi:hypothetical protein
MVVASASSGSPRHRIEAASARCGRAPFALSCANLLRGGPVEEDLVVVLGGAAAGRVLHDPAGRQQYWLRVWATRGLLWAWHPSALPALLGACADGEWRVREMAAKVVARHLVGGAFDAGTPRRDDPVPRGRVAASRAVAVLTAGGL